MRTSTMLKVPAGLIAAVLAVASLAPVAQAQNSSVADKMNVPFAFEAAGRHFAPGVYTISLYSEQTMMIRGNSNAGIAIIQLANDGHPATRGKAVFTRYGNKYFLSGVWFAENNGHLLCNPSKAERQLQVLPAQPPTAVELALLQTGL